MEQQLINDILELLENLKASLAETTGVSAKLAEIEATLAALNADANEAGKIDPKKDKRLSTAVAAQDKLLKQLEKLNAKNDRLEQRINLLLEKLNPQLDPIDMASMQVAIREANENLQHTRAEIKAAKEQLPAIETTLARLLLQEQTKEIKKQVKQVEKTQKELLAEIKRLEKVETQFLNQLVAVLINFYSKADPRQVVEMLSDDIPFLLLPVRLETRFMIVKHVARTAPVPDPGDAPVLMEVSTEYKMPQVQPLQQEPRRVADKYELWIRIYPDDISLHTHEDRLSQDEYDAAFNYWVEVWRAGSDSNLELGAWRALAGSYGSRRAAWIAQQTEPTNPLDKPAAPVPEGTPLTTDPVLPVLSLKPSSWTEAPHTRVMPDQFVARIYTGTSYREVVGLPVPNPLPVGMDPSADYTSLLDQQDGIINMPPEIKWLSDFEEAVKVGMGIRVPITAAEMDSPDGFSRLLVLGLRLTANAETSQQQLEELINNHHYKTGFALLAQGTPTNNSDNVPSGYSTLEPGEEISFAVERQGPLFTATTDHSQKKDGQRLAEALGISNTVLEHVQQSNGRDGAESICMNKALWPATMGYYMKQMLTPSAAAADIANTKKFFTNYVHGRGLVPAFRVGKQPYGVHPATVYSRWKYSNSTRFESKLHKNILQPLSSYLENLVLDVASVNSLNASSNPDPKATLLDILGLHPSSVEYHQRFTAGSYLMWNMRRFVAGRSIAVDPNFPIMNGTQEQNFDYVFQNNLGFSYSLLPRIFSMTFLKEHRLLNGPVIDTLPLSETRSIQNIPATVKNYIEWLQVSTLQQVRTENFTNIGASATQKPPQALLYLLLRHACFLEFLNVSYSYLISAQVISAEATIDNELLNLIAPSEDQLSDEVIATLRQTVVAELNQANEFRIQTEVQRLMGDTGSATEKTQKDFEEQLRLVTAAEVESVVERVFSQRLKTLQVDQAKWNYLTQPVKEVSGQLAMEDFIMAEVQVQAPLTQSLIEVKNALNCLSKLPTARLERCLSEHLDCCSYRLDAWMTGLVTQRLDEQRTEKRDGIYLGAYSILENVKSGNFPGIHVQEVIPVRVPPVATSPAAAEPAPETRAAEQLLPPLHVSYAKPLTFTYLGSDPFTQLMEDPLSGKVIPVPRINPDNQGYILAPSLNHAVTAAILRAGYVAHRNTTSNDDALAVNLTSSRVRKALYYLEGIRHGNSLNALLGYQFERGLHDAQILDNANDYTLDEYILDIRLKYPLVTNSVVANPLDPVTNVNDSEARNVTDGLALIEAYRKTVAPFWDDGLTIAAPSKTLIIAEIEKIINDMDAIGDLLLSESVFQTARGNHERAGAVIKAMGEGNNIPEPEIINTPRTSHVLTHRFAIQLNPATASGTVWSAAATPRSYSEPALNSWLALQLPVPAKIMARVEYTDNADQPQVYNVTLADLGIEPVDLVYIYATVGDAANADAAELSARIILFIKQTFALAETNEVQIYYRDRSGFQPDERTLFELLPLLRGLSQLISNSRALKAEDLLLPAEADAILASSVAGVNTTALHARLTDAVGPAVTPGRRGLLDVLQDLAAAELAAEALAYPPVPVSAFATLNTLRDEIRAAAGFGIDAAIPLTGNDDGFKTRDQLVSQSKVVRAELQRRYNRASVKLTALIPVTDERERARKLAEIAQLVFGRSFKVYPEFTIHNQPDYTSSFNNTSLLSNAGPFAVDEWMHGVSRVRKNMNGYRKLMLVAEAVTARAFTPHDVVQFPLHLSGTDSWLGLEIPAGYEVAGDTLSVVMELPPGYTPGQTHAGIMLDEWTEDIPVENTTTGIAMHYDEPNNEAPQSLLLAVTPEIKGNWLWNDLMDTLNETLDMAKKRAVEPDHIQQTILSQVLPAIMAPVNGTSAAPGLDFGRNIVQASPGQSGPIVLADYIIQAIDDTNLSPQ